MTEIKQIDRDAPLSGASLYQNMKQEYPESHFLSAGEVNAEGEMSLPILASKIIDIATAHANSLGIGNPDMPDTDMGWVLSRLTVEMERWPRADETYSITTWIEEWNRHFSLRCFCIADAGGSTLGYARTVWMVMNTRTRENAGLSRLNLAPEMVSARECPIDRQAKHRTIVEAGNMENAPRNSLTATEETGCYRFRYCDIDFYRHVNTVRYIDLLLNRFPLERYDRDFIKRVELNFLHEAKYGTEVRILTSKSEENPELFNMALVSDDKTLLFARLLFAGR